MRPTTDELLDEYAQAIVDFVDNKIDALGTYQAESLYNYVKAEAAKMMIEWIQTWEITHGTRRSHR